MRLMTGGLNDRYKSTAARLVAFEVEHPAVSSLEAVLAELRQGLQWLAGEIGAMWERNRQVYEAQMNDIEASTYAEVRTDERRGRRGAGGYGRSGCKHDL